MPPLPQGWETPHPLHSPAMGSSADIFAASTVPGRFQGKPRIRSMNKRFKVVIAGAGGMGSAAGLLLRELGDFEVDVFIGDSNEARARAAAAWIHEGSERPGEVTAFRLPSQGSSPDFVQVLEQGNILLDCLPGKEAPRLARLARAHHLHYANLTEHVKETQEVMAIAAGAEEGFLLQTGLAPGFVDVLGHGLYQRFCRDHGATQAESLACGWERSPPTPTRRTTTASPGARSGWRPSTTSRRRSSATSSRRPAPRSPTSPPSSSTASSTRRP